MAEQIAVGTLAAYGASTRRAYRRDLTDWFSYCRRSGIDPLAARRLDVDLFRMELIERRGLAPSTIVRRLAAINNYYAMALAEGAVDRNPTTGVKRPKVDNFGARRPLSVDEVRSLLGATALDARLHALLYLLATTGARINEILAADVDDLGRDGVHVVLTVVRKGSKRDTLVVAPAAQRALNAYLGDRGDGPLFMTRSGGRLARNEVSRMMKAAAATVLPHVPASRVHPHVLRHSFCSALVEADVPLFKVQLAAAHASPETTSRRYARLANPHDGHPSYQLSAALADEPASEQSGIDSAAR